MKKHRVDVKSNYHKSLVSLQAECHIRMILKLLPVRERRMIALRIITRLGIFSILLASTSMCCLIYSDQGHSFLPSLFLEYSNFSPHRVSSSPIPVYNPPQSLPTPQPLLTQPPRYHYSLFTSQSHTSNYLSSLSDFCSLTAPTSCLSRQQSYALSGYVPELHQTRIVEKRLRHDKKAAPLLWENLPEVHALLLLEAKKTIAGKMKSFDVPSDKRNEPGKCAISIRAPALERSLGPG